ncbi:MAG: phosphoglycerate dehydrogenase [Candidatus Lambdaproteobacteria bacterium RIFOXYD1_FULL_56_27]|uniref:D-3-phosphoglycerate dehydrogenase n=1 Tax=Candidatus Lambdaproteobacteria bacterium RIFOXYD2_FULL_56_26 TaxID=1817773 RepID=A0A1F6H358_9PROT|nr:MAG: phosphoglycerate dehydrogenase [Candidatus Lambdaproteobacteria bacterium RIFOXYD2_FULL_56_26]OGH05403.1 MAG: phosphoglycerate dehydrogenase [Candidatus Lambdaproteobacteria bacterium RIFOXYC1_FULL_56_13]OGH09247.1 MAG: phosphoglycerate dehydrogenase [Candidatus Lambdaproteobacteria bacterium RIFOXYD1_FULL_56_27]
MKKILITGKLHQVALDNLAAQPDLEIDYRPDPPREELLSIVGEFDCIISRSETDIDKELIDKASKLSVIARAAVGIGNIDVDYATQKGILVFNTPAKNTNSAAELTLMLMLSAMRKLVPAHKSMEADQWNRHKFTGTELLGKTIGIIGLGNVGHRVARFCNSFDCKVLAYDPYVSREYCSGHNAEQVTFDRLIAESDLITIHTPKNKETVNMVGDKEIAQMKKGVILINAARGGLFNEEAMVRGLESGKIAAIGLDTWDVEPVKEHPLKNRDNVVMTPHIGASTQEAQYRIGDTVTKETIKALRGEIVSTPVNLPDVHAFENPEAQVYASLAAKLGSFTRQYIGVGFSPQKVEFCYRGDLNQGDWSLIRLSYLKELLQGTAEATVSYVNVLQIAEARGLKIIERADRDFTDYESAIRIILSGDNQQIAIGGTVLGRQRGRLSYLNGFVFEVEPQGRILAVENRDLPGVIGHIGTVLGRNGVNIQQFELSRNVKGGEAMALVLVDEPINTRVMDELKQHNSILQVKVIEL